MSFWMPRTNIVTIAGKLCNEPMTRITDTGHTVCSFSVQVQAPRRKAPNFFDCKLMGANRVTFMDNIPRGTAIMVYGHLESLKNPETGLNRTFIVVDSMERIFVPDEDLDTRSCGEESGEESEERN